MSKQSPFGPNSFNKEIAAKMTLEEALAAHPDFDPEHVINAYLNAVGLVNEGKLAEMPAPSTPTAQTEDNGLSTGDSSEVQQGNSPRSSRRKPIEQKPGDSSGAEGPAV